MSAEIKNRPQDLWGIAPRERCPKGALPKRSVTPRERCPKEYYPKEHYPKERCPKGVRSKVGAEKDKIRLYGPKNFKIYEKISFIIK